MIKFLVIEHREITREPAPVIVSDSENGDTNLQESLNQLLLRPGDALIVAHQGDSTSPVLQAANLASVQLAQSAI